MLTQRRRVRRGVGGAVVVLMLSAVASAQWTWTPQTGRWINIKNLPKETAELQLEYARSLMLEGDYKHALRETNKFTQFYADSDLADDNQFLRGAIRVAQGNSGKAAKELQQVITTYPDTDLYDQVIAKQYEIGDRLYEKGQANLRKHWRPYRKRPFKSAIELYTMVIESQPFTNVAAEAQYKLGLCQFTREEYITAAYEYRRVIEDYSDSDWVDDAGHGLATCYYEASLPADYDQTPSELAVRAIDDFTGRFPNDARVDDLRDRRREMRETMARQRLKVAQFYKKRRQFKAARISFEVVVEQFADTAVLDEAQRWLAENPSADSPTFGEPQEAL